jgi:two-component system, sensor histidine kinase and response regulator
MHKVLVVDDTKDARVVLARLLRLGGYQAVLADDGPSALQSVETEHPDLVLLDLMMPDMNGVQVLENLRHDPRYKSLPVILFTAVADGELIQTASRLGIQDLILKGAVNGFNLLERIGRLLPSDQPTH